MTERWDASASSLVSRSLPRSRKIRLASLDSCLAFYADLGHRRRRWKTAIKAQQSEEKLYKRLAEMGEG